MNDTIFSVSDASRLAEVKSHVLRYWEEEMNLPINRNEMGHRYYTQLDIQVFLSIKELKKKGLSLKEIGEVVLLMYGITASDEPKEEDSFVIPEQFYAVLEKLVAAKQREEKGDETRYKKLDQAIRHHQQSRKQIAATLENDRKRKRIGKRKENKNT